MLPAYSAKKPWTILVCMVLVITLGVMSFTRMPSTLLPEFELPYVVAVTTYPGAGPEKVEKAITKPLEAALSTTNGIKSVSSVSSEGMSVVIMEFAYETNMDSALIEMNSSIDLIKGYFDDTVSPTMLMQIDPDMMPVMVAAVDIDGMDAVQASAYVQDTVVPVLERVDGVADVSAMGLVKNAVNITLDDEKLDALQEKFDAEVYSKFEEPQQKIEDARTELADAKAEAYDELDSQAEKISNGKKELRNAKKELSAAIEQLGEAIALMESGAVPGDSLEQSKAQLEALNTQMDELKSQERKLSSGETAFEETRSDADNQFADSEEQLDEAQEELDEALSDALLAADVREMITSSMITGILAASNFSMPAGYVYEDDARYSVKVGNPFESIEELNSLTLFDSGINDIGIVHIYDVADVNASDNSDEIYAKINGNDGILMTFQKQSSASTTDVSKGLREAMESLENNNNALHMTQLTDQGVYIEIIVQTVIENLLMGAALAVIILLLFLRSVKPTFIVALSIPISLLLAVTLMYFTGITLNLISLAGLALGIGMLVDNSIVVIDNIYRLRREGMSAIKAAVQGTKEVAGAIIASTLTTVCVFLPIVFTEGISRELFVDMGLTIAYSLVSSLLVAMTLVPATGSMMLGKINEKEDRVMKAFTNAYTRSLGFVLDHKAIFIIAAVALFGVSVYGAVNSGTAFMPESDTQQIMLSVTLNEKIKDDDAQKMMDKAAVIIEEIDGVSTVGVLASDSVGLMGMGAAGGDFTAYVLLDETRSATSGEIAVEIEKRLLDADMPISIDTSSGSMDISSLSGSGIQVDIYGDDLDALRETAREIASIAASIEGVGEVDDGVGETETGFNVSVDKNKALEYGLTVAQVYSAVSDALSTSDEAAELSLSGDDYTVIVEKSTSENVTKDSIGDIVIKGTKDGETMRLALSEIADISESESQTSIRRNNSRRKISVSLGIATGYNIGNVSKDVESALNAYTLPDGFSLDYSGENETINDTLRDLIQLGLLAVLLIYLIMVAQFQSLLSPFIVMFTLPLAFTGGLLLQWICGFEVSVISMLGLIVLLGVVVNNGIVFVDCANQLYGAGMSKREALIETARRRIRPILMTALTTVLGLVTLAFGVGSGAEMLQPMAVVIIGGLSYGTLLTLFIIPSMYDIMRSKPPRVVDAEQIKAQ